jgi:hypothetical protein
MKNAVASDAVATPKLIDICCMVLAMVNWRCWPVPR